MNQDNNGFCPCQCKTGYLMSNVIDKASIFKLDGNRRLVKRNPPQLSRKFSYFHSLESCLHCALQLDTLTCHRLAVGVYKVVSMTLLLLISRVFMLFHVYLFLVKNKLTILIENNKQFNLLFNSFVICLFINYSKRLNY